MKRLYLLLVLISLTSISAFGIYEWLYRDTTTYSSAYSEDAFSKVRAGMSESEVLALLGQPLEVREVDVAEKWYYREAKLIRSGLFRQHVKVEGFLESPSYVMFDSTGKVLDSEGTDTQPSIRRGLSKAEVISLLGKPSRQEPGYTRIFYYTEPGGEGIFQARFISFNQVGRVSSVIRYKFHD